MSTKGTRGVRVDVVGLLRRPGAQRHIENSLPLGPIQVTSARVPDDGQVTFDLMLEAQGVQVVVTGEVSAPWVGDCRRCLEPTSGEVRAKIREIFERDAVEEETWPIIENQIDLEPLLFETVMLELPLAPLCSPDCQGPAPNRFPTGSASEHPEEPVKDPRWAALDQLRFDDD